MLIFKDGVVGHYKRIFSNVSFPAAGPTDTFLSSNGALRVLVKPHDSTTQKLTDCDPYVENGAAYTQRVESKTEEDIAIDVAAKASLMRTLRDKALAASDWTQLADAPVDKAAWATYRQALRDLPSNSNWPNVELPVQPS